MADLARIKPDPLPALDRAVLETGEGISAGVDDAVRSAMGVPWTGVVVRAISAHRPFWDVLWPALDPLFRSEEMTRACNLMQRDTERMAAAFAPSYLGPRLLQEGYDRTDIAEIRDTIEVFHQGNLPYVFLATIARIGLEATRFGRGRRAVEDTGRAPPLNRPVELIDPAKAGPELAPLFADIRQTTGLPFVNSDYRALGKWPVYLGAAWSSLGPAIQSRDYEPLVSALHHRFVRAASALPNPGRLELDELHSAAEEEGKKTLLRDTVRLFQWLLPGLVTNVAILRAQLMPGDRDV